MPAVPPPDKPHAGPQLAEKPFTLPGAAKYRVSFRRGGQSRALGKKPPAAYIPLPGQAAASGRPSAVSRILPAHIRHI
ncbi:hypothetical protein Defa_29410 [Desulfovibrio sp. TH_2024_36128]|uniref:Uncharacterized protein n=1 Tax=Desulfovibrio falkowii TaxID=3136602 RepID=A0ABQ0ECB8_9BACT